MLKNFLHSNNTFRLLLLLNVVVSVVMFLLFFNDPGKDATTYLGLAEGILKGSYSYWNFLEHPMPDTLRNPGYPLFLALFKLFSDSILAIQIAQLVLYIVSIMLALSVLEILYGNISIKNIFLLILLPSVYVASYTAIIFPEILVTFLLLLIIWTDLKMQSSLKKYILLGLLFGITFQVRPVILFLPILYIIYQFVVHRNNFSTAHSLLLLTVFFLTMIPYGLWNKSNHGVFKVTSLEGGGGLLHLGYWSFKMPDYYDTRYWGNYCNREMIALIDEKDRNENIERYNQEWDIIDSITAPLLTNHDSIMMVFAEKNPSFLKTFNGPYTIKREALLRQFAMENIRADFPFYLKVKFYSAVRLWVTGLRMKDFNASGPVKKAYLLYPLLITLVAFLAAIILIPLAIYRNRKLMTPLLWIIIIILYIGIIHIPFTIQARYTIPVRLELLMVVSVAAWLLFSERKKQDSSVY